MEGPRHALRAWLPACSNAAMQAAPYVARSPFSTKVTRAIDTIVQ